MYQTFAHGRYSQTMIYIMLERRNVERTNTRQHSQSCFFKSKIQKRHLV